MTDLGGHTDRRLVARRLHILPCCRCVQQHSGGLDLSMSRTDFSTRRGILISGTRSDAVRNAAAGTGARCFTEGRWQPRCPLCTGRSVHPWGPLAGEKGGGGRTHSIDGGEGERWHGARLGHRGGGKCQGPSARVMQHAVSAGGSHPVLQQARHSHLTAGSSRSSAIY